MSRDQLGAAATLLSAARQVTLLAHVQPDADSLGSALALGIALHRRGVATQVSFCTPERMPEALRILDVHGLVVPPAQVVAAPEVVVACDAAEPARLGTLADRLDRAEHSIMIDHHVTNPGFGDVRLLDPGAEATVVIVRRLLAAMAVPLDIDVARCIYAGLVTDTQNFVNAGSAAHLLAAELITAGVAAEPLVRSLMFSHPYPWLAALGRMLQRAQLDPGAAAGLGLVHTTVTHDDLRGFRQQDVDSVVDVLRTTTEAAVAAVFKQVGDRQWITSLRSDNRIDVSAVAGRLDGGGHPGAAGFTWSGTEGELLAALRSALADVAVRGLPMTGPVGTPSLRPAP